MKRLCVPFLFVSALAVSPSSAAAQQQGDVGLLMAVPAEVGVLWHVTDTVAVRPTIDFSSGSSRTSTPGGGESESSSRGFAVGASVLFYLNDADNVRTYVAPRLQVVWASSDDRDSPSDVSTDAYGASVSYGAQYTPVSRLSLFGEVGVEYSRATTEVEGLDLKTRSSSWSPRAQVGLVFYFRD